MTKLVVALLTDQLLDLIRHLILVYAAFTALGLSLN